MAFVEYTRNMTQRVLFIHRSCGANLLEQGQVRQKLAAFQPTAILLDDYNQNSHHVTTAEGSKRLFRIDFAGNDTTPAAYAAFFNPNNLQDTPLKEILTTYNAVIIKSCYPNNAIKSDEQLAALRQNYKDIIAFFAQLPGKHLGIVTTPPLLPSKTTPEDAARARQLADWLAKTNLGERVKVFNFYSQLASDAGQPDANMLRRDFRRWWTVLGIKDSHPNRRANRSIGPLFAQWLNRLID